MNLEELGRRAVACPRWRWMPGMMLQWKPENGSHYRGRVCDTWSFVNEGALYCEGHEDRFTREELKAAWPDLSDPATLGCLVALVEEAWKCPIDMSFAGACRFDVDAEERVYPQDHTVSFAAKTRVEALVAALEAAP